MPCARRWPPVGSPSMPVSIPPPPACTPDTWCRCSRSSVSSAPAIARSCWPAAPPDSSATGAIIVNNMDWTGPLSTVDFLRDVGKHFSINVMLARDTIKRRLDGEGISYTEFSYMLLQANDYLQLRRKFDCTLQVGGSDQW